jgi:hypothetical protein
MPFPHGQPARLEDGSSLELTGNEFARLPGAHLNGYGSPGQ